MPGGNLIDRRAQSDRVGAATPTAIPRMHSAQPDGGPAGVVAVAVAERICLSMRQTAQHEQVIPDWRERTESRRELEPGADRGRHEGLLDDAVRRAVDESEPPGRGGLGGHREG